MNQTAPEPPSQSVIPSPSSLDSLPKISARAISPLNAAGFTKLRGLADVPRFDLAQLHGMGSKALRIIEEDHVHRQPPLGAVLGLIMQCAADFPIVAGRRQIDRPDAHVNCVALSLLGFGQRLVD